MRKSLRERAAHIWLYLGTLMKWLAFAVITGVFCGVIGSVFHIGVHHATELRMEHPWLLYCLPVAGLLIGVIYKGLGTTGYGTNTIINEVHSGDGISFWLLPTIFFSTMLTHLGNGCPNMIGRHHNPIFSGLAEERLTAMIITDGHHLPGELIRIIIRTKGVDKVIVTSDASSPTGLPPGKHVTLGVEAVLEANGKLHIPERKCLAGSASTAAMCMNFLDSLDFLTCDELKLLGRDNALKLLGKL